MAETYEDFTRQDLIDTIGDLEQELNRRAPVEPAAGWIPVSERLPAEGVEVAVYFRSGDSREIDIGEVRDGAWGDRRGGEWIGSPTHWMPLPDVSRAREEKAESRAKWYCKKCGKLGTFPMSQEDYDRHLSDSATCGPVVSKEPAPSGRGEET